jgi:hypothetical protein
MSVISAVERQRQEDLKFQVNQGLHRDTLSQKKEKIHGCLNVLNKIRIHTDRPGKDKYVRTCPQLRKTALQHANTWPSGMATPNS